MQPASACKSVFPASAATATGLHQLIEYQARRQPLEPALRFGDATLSYADLDAQSTRLAQVLVALSLPAPFVGISTCRGFFSIVALVAVLKAGKAYLPLDPTYPEARLQQFLTDTGTTHCLATDADADRFAGLGLQVVLPDARPPQPAPPLPPTHEQQLAYIIYTSGSTGLPKGVGVPHAGVLNLLRWQQRNSRMSEGSRVLLFAPLTFDASVQELFFSFFVGGTLVLVDEDLRLDPKYLLQYLDAHQVNRLDLPFVALQYLVDTAVASGHFPNSMQELLTGGEQLKITPALRQFFTALPGCAFFNQYGPTETSITVTNLELSGPPAQWPNLPSIGRPIDEVAIVILDEHQQLVAPGAAGELCIGGACLTAGYYQRPEATARQFIRWKDASGREIRLYRSGDLGRYLPDGNIQYLGRLDRQVKIRGNRVEVGEVEVALNQLAGVQQAVAEVQPGRHGQAELVAYLVAHAHPVPTAELRRQLSRQLPDYMVPSHFLWLPELPRTSSGKVDRRALPRPDLLDAPDRPYAPPTTPLEQLLCAIWQDVLQLPRIGRTDHFFELGGTSLLAVRMMAQVEARTGQRLALSALVQAPTVQQLAAQLQETPPAQWSSLVTLREGGAQVPLYLVHGMGLNVLVFQHLCAQLPPDQPVYALQGIGLDGHTPPPASVPEVARRYVEEMLAHNPTGPYVLAGYSLGSILAFEMARELLQRGQAVPVVVVFDHEAPAPTPPPRLRLNWQRTTWVMRSFLQRPALTLSHYQRFAAWKLSALLQQLPGRPASAPDPHPLRPLMEHYARLTDAHALRPLPVTVHLFRARDRVHTTFDPAYYGWAAYAQGGVVCHDLPGTHDELLMPRHVAAVARQLEKLLTTVFPRITQPALVC